MTASAVLVSGANGFIGSALCRQLAASGYRVRGTVRRKHESESGGIEFCTVGAIDESTDWSSPLAGMEAVIHAAARVHVTRDTAANPQLEFDRVNEAGSVRLARQSVDAGVRRFVFLSSIGAAVAETATAGGCRPTPYQISKLHAERALSDALRKTDTELVIVRPPLVYGPGARGNLPRLIRLVDRGIPLPLASIRNRRSLVGLTNLCDLLLRCLERPEAAGETFSAADETVSTPALVRRIAEALGRPARLWPCPPALLRMAGWLTGRQAAVAGLVESLEVDARKARHVLGWSPATSMAEELARTAREWRSHDTR